jgi:hypothetical protein
MFVVGDKLISDAILEAPFACNLGACRGACCVQGDPGAPLEPEERAELERLLPVIRGDLRPEALAVVEQDGVWEEIDGEYFTTCVDHAECVFVVYDGPVAKCAIQKAYHEGRVDFPKPVSCHLFPIRVARHGAYEVLNYERISPCDPARAHGRRHNVLLVDLLREALERKYGPAWYAAFRQACEERVRELNEEASRVE